MIFNGTLDDEATKRLYKENVIPDFEQWAANLAKIPVYAFVGALDKTVLPDRSERMIAAVKKAGGKEARLKIYPAEVHGAGRVVVNDAEYYEWLFSKQRRSTSLCSKDTSLDAGET